MGKEVKLYELPVRVVKHYGRKIVEAYRKKEAVRWLKTFKHKKVDCSRPIKIGFIVQMPEIWDKEKPVFNQMEKDERFTPYMVIVPAYDFEHGKIGDYGKEKGYFIKESGGKYILARNEDGSWLKIRRGDFDYIFYQRPYNIYLPSGLRSNSLVKKAKLCYIPYATTESAHTVTRPDDFFCSLYIGFLEDLDTARAISLQYKKTTSRELQHFVGIGYPVFEKCIDFNVKCKYKKILWTPRWSYDSNIGGSHFFEYREFLEDFQRFDVELTIRPHPLMWQNFIKTGVCTYEDIISIRKKWDYLGISEDNNPSIEETFRNTDVLISDSSSVIPLFFLSGKPIIFCPDGQYDAKEHSILLNTIIPGLYIANNDNDLRSVLSSLINHEDPLFDVRRTIINSKFINNINATRNIVEYIKNDFILNSGD